MAADKAKQKANPTLKPPNPQPTKPQLASWADRVKVTDSSTRFTLDPITKTDDGELLDITADMLTDDAEQWNRCMVGFFPGFRMNYNTVNAVAHRVWKAGGLESVMSTANGFWLFRFNTEDSMHAILERGPWMFGGKTMILQQWHPQFVFDKNRISKLPVWIRIHGLPFSLWSRKGLSTVASRVGRPLSCDEQTFCGTRLDYARVCVEIDAAMPFVNRFDINTPFAQEPLHLEVEYEWRPPRCEKCKFFGHVCPQQQGNETKNGVSPPPQCPDKEAKDQPRVHLHVQEAGPASHHREKNIDAIPATQTKGSTTAPLSAKEPSTSMAKGDKGVDNLQLKTSQQEVDAARTKKGKMKETILNPCTTIESDSSRSQQLQDEEGSSETNANYGCDTGSRDMSPTAFTKVKKKKGGKGKKEAHRL
ncbi:hypothetical protein OIU84_003685 [Salix udensis]|uniref:DUF4283 domain-containing protein n=1 Tax=Salix udensis TaxID=889485 RepID=A0AAD6K0T2_9ROSI|nr:hypothetical protein OIU84_003685 [Salix udensis]